MEVSFRKHNLLFILAIAWSLATLSLILRLFYYPELGWKLALLNYAFSTIMLVVVFYLLQSVHLGLNKIMPYDSWGFRRFIVQNIVFILLAVVFTRSILWLSHWVADNTSLFPPHVKAMMYDRNILLFAYITYILIVSVINLGFYTWYLFEKWQQTRDEKMRLEVTAAELEKEKARMQYESLKNQLNPHFLFNSFTSLNSLIYKNPALAQDFLQQLAKVYRHLLRSNKVTLVSLEEEITFVTNYISLQQTRFSQGLQVHMHIPENLWQKKVVPITLQMLIENAIKHNIIDPDQPLQISIKAVSDNCIEVSNNYHPKKNVENSNRQGLEGLKRLYTYYSTTPLEVQCNNVIFSVRIPLI